MEFVGLPLAMMAQAHYVLNFPAYEKKALQFQIMLLTKKNTFWVDFKLVKPLEKKKKKTVRTEPLAVEWLICPRYDKD